MTSRPPSPMVAPQKMRRHWDRTTNDAPAGLIGEGRRGRRVLRLGESARDCLGCSRASSVSAESSPCVIGTRSVAHKSSVTPITISQTDHAM